MVHIPDTEMPADFLTKWMSDAGKLRRSLRYATNSGNVTDLQSERATSHASEVGGSVISRLSHVSNGAVTDLS